MSWLGCVGLRRLRLHLHENMKTICKSYENHMNMVPPGPNGASPLGPGWARSHWPDRAYLFICFHIGVSYFPCLFLNNSSCLSKDEFVYQCFV